MTDRNGLSGIEFALLGAIRLQAELQNALVALDDVLERDASGVRVPKQLYTANSKIDEGLSEVSEKLNVGIPGEFDRGDEAETAAYLCEEITLLTDSLSAVDEVIECGTLTEPTRAELVTGMERLAKELQRVIGEVKRRE